jgi:hypothetical protein
MPENVIIELETPLTIDELQDELNPKEIDDIFETTRVTFVKPKEGDEGKKLQVTIRNNSKSPGSKDCYVALGFDYVDPGEHFAYELHHVSIPHGRTADAHFTPPKDWQEEEGPRWIIVLISLEEIKLNVLKDELTHDPHRKKRKKLIRFSMDLKVVDGRDRYERDEEEPYEEEQYADDEE